MANIAPITLDIVLLETGIWCEKHMLPCKIKYGVYWLKSDRVVNMGVRIICGREEI